MNLKSSLFTAGSVLLAGSLGVQCQSSKSVDDQTGDQRPNILVIFLDDMGYSDIGCFGSEIETPNIDGLTQPGMVMTQFYNTSRSCPSRASLLTGLYSHKTGIGDMTSDFEIPSYRGFLNDSCVTIAEVLKQAGYSTYISGKWHVGGQRPHWPAKRGFERFYGFPKGGGVYFYPFRKDRHLVEDTTVLQPDSTFYSTDNFTDYAIGYIHEHPKKEKPFFLYLPYIAPHFPLQAHQKDIDKYRGKYSKGFEHYRQARYQRMLELGIIDSTVHLSPADDQVLKWEELSEQERDEFDLRMAVYAAQLECVDRNIGRLMTALKETGQYENTVIMFLSDNGACAEGLGYGTRHEEAPIGSRESFTSYQRSWANVSNTPYRMYKHWVHEGGILTPFIVHYPKLIKERRIDRQVAHIIDIMPTCCDLAQTEYPQTYESRTVIPVDGLSLLPIFKGEKRKPHDVLYWEHEGNRAVRKGNWKLVSPYESGEWELYNLEEDPSELYDLGDSLPQKAADLQELYDRWAVRHRVVSGDSLRVLWKTYW